MHTNQRPAAPTNRPDSGDRAIGLNLSREVRSTLAEWTFLLGGAENARWLGSHGLNAVDWARADLHAATRARKLILITPDDEGSQRFARDIGAKIAAHGLVTFRVWVLTGLGSRSASVQQWCEENDLPAALARDRPWEPAVQPAAGAACAASTAQSQPPRFTSDPRPLKIELLPVPRLEDRLIPASLRGWVADIADRGGFPLEYPAAAAIVGLSGLIGRWVALRPKRADDWLVVPNLRGAVVGPPGIQKTLPRSRRPCGRCDGWPRLVGMVWFDDRRRGAPGGWHPSRPRLRQDR
jgi:hypothetical protein